MSLVGNLEDLSLGDILQIISLSQKFGVLALESDFGSGRIVFRSGLVQGACLKGVGGHFTDLRSLVVGKGILDPAGFDACAARAEDLGMTVEEVLRSEASLELGGLDAMAQEAVEAAVLEMFTWPSGDFSFDVRSEAQDGDPQLILKTGINAQYLAMEGMRMADEDAVRTKRAGAGSDESVMAIVGELLDKESDTTVGELLDEVSDSAVVEPPAPEESSENAAVEPAATQESAANVVVEATLANRDEDTSDADVEEEVDSTAPHPPRPLILIDPDVAVLEWVKRAVQGDFQHVHVFQQADQGLMRIRQYLIRGELPVVLISLTVEIDALSGIRGFGDFVKRLKTQAAKLPIIGLVDAEETAPAMISGDLDGTLVRPPRKSLSNADDTGSDSAARELSSALADLLSD